MMNYISCFVLLIMGSALSAQTFQKSDTALYFNGDLVNTVIIDSISQRHVFFMIENHIEKINKKRVPCLFKPMTNKEPICKMNFRYEDDYLADDVFVEGDLLGYNQQYFLLKYHDNGKKILDVIHQSHIAGKDLKAFRQAVSKND